LLGHRPARRPRAARHHPRRARHLDRAGDPGGRRAGPSGHRRHAQPSGPRARRAERARAHRHPARRRREDTALAARWMSGLTASVEIRVIYGDTDQAGIVYYANYLRFFEASRGAFLRERGRSYVEIEAAGLTMPVIEAHVRYLRPARYDDLIVVKVRLA